MSNPAHIVRAELADAASILALQRCAYQSEARLYEDWSLPPLLETLEQLQADFGVSLILKAMQGGELVGAVRGKCVAGRCTIGRLIVQPSLQGCGIGSALLQRVEQELPTVECFELFTGTRSARNIALYERLGYRQCRLQTISDTLTLVWMEKCRALD